MLQTNFGIPASSGSREQLGTQVASGTERHGRHGGIRFEAQFQDMVALQRHIILMRKKQVNGNDVVLDEGGDEWLPNGAPQPVADDARPRLVPVPDAMKGPKFVAWNLAREANCTEEQIDAVALLALSLQKRFENRLDKSTHLLPVGTSSGNHRAVWLGGGGVGKTHTLSRVIEPMAITYFGEGGYLAKAQSNHAAHNLGSRGRTIHSANGILMSDCLQTARLRLNLQTQKKLARLLNTAGVAVIDEVGAVQGSLLHADALRSTYGRALYHNLDSTRYMQPQETWGRMAAQILCGDFFQLPPVPASSSLLAPQKGQSYEHQQGRKLLADMEYVVEFVQMQRFTDQRLLEVLNAMRTPGGKKISDESWQALVDTEIRSSSSAAQPAGDSSSSSAAQPADNGNGAAEQLYYDPRLRAARGWYESAHEWRIVSYAMHTQAKLDAHDAGEVLFYIPAVDRPAGTLNRQEFEEMLGEPNIGHTGKMPGLLPLFIGMAVVLTESLLPPKYVRGASGKVVGIEFHPDESAVESRPSIQSDGVVMLRYMPKCVYVKMEGSDELFLKDAPGTPGSASQSADLDLRGVLAITPQARSWKFKPAAGGPAIQVSRTQLPVLPQKQCTLHGVQGKTADPGFIVHWRFPPGLKKETLWLAYYVSLSRPRSFAQLLSHGLPDRSVIESGPPEEIANAFAEFFANKIAETKIACADARKDLGWPARS